MGCGCDEKVRYDSALYYRTDYIALAGVSTSAMSQYDYISNAVDEISCAARNTGGYGTIKRVEVIEDGTTVQKKDIRIWLFSSNITTPVSNSARSFTAGENDYIVGYIDIAAADYKATNGTAYAYANVSCDVKFKCADGVQTLFFVVEANGSSAPTYDNATPLKFRFLLERN